MTTLSYVNGPSTETLLGQTIGENLAADGGALRITGGARRRTVRPPVDL